VKIILWRNLKILAKTTERALPLSFCQAPNWVSSVVCQRVLFGDQDVLIWQEHTKRYPQGSPVDTLRSPAVAWKMSRHTNNTVISAACFPDHSRPLPFIQPLYKEKHQLYSGHLNDALWLLLYTARKQREGNLATALCFSFALPSQGVQTDEQAKKTLATLLQCWAYKFS